MVKTLGSQCILECEVKWALGSITTNKASGDDRIPAELLQILKDDAVKVPHATCQQIWKTQQWPQVSFHHNSKEGQGHRMNKLLHNCIHFTRKVMLKVLQARLQQYVSWEFPDVQARFRKGRGARDQIANIHWIIKKSKRILEKHLFLLHCYTKAFDCVDHNKLENSLRDGNTRPPDLPAEKSVWRSRGNS